MNDRGPGGVNNRIDAQRARESLARLMEIYRGIAEKADEVSLRRCPYKNARARCTASFKCRNQYFTRLPGELPVCTGSDKLDYRKAWETGAPAEPATDSSASTT